MLLSSGLIGSVDSTIVVARDVDLFLILIRQGRRFHLMPEREFGLQNF